MPLDADARESLTAAADAIALALQRSHLLLAIELHRPLRNMLNAFTRAARSNADHAAGLRIVCEGAVQIFAADRAELWLHERHTRELVCRAASDIDPSKANARVSVEDALSIAATALRRERSELFVVGETQAGLSAPSGIAIPLRGRRRALGALIIEGARVERRSVPDLLARADQLGWQLSAAIENAQLLENVLASRRQLETVLDSIDDLVVVCDVGLHIVPANEPFVVRSASTRSDIADRPLAEFVGPELQLWVETAAASRSEPLARATILETSG
jgi:PAS domain-containing protein